MSDFDDKVVDLRILTKKIDDVTIKLERHLAQHETTSSNARWLKWFFDFLRTTILIYIVLKELL